ncbi:MAG: radical SAM protein [Bacillota bacterium]
MRVLLIQPRPRNALGFKNVICTEPLGLEIVAAALNEHEVKLIDLLDGSLPLAEIQEFAPAAVGISCSFTVDTYAVIAIAQALRRVLKEVFIFTGGHHASLNYADFFDPAIDAIVIGEGETTTPELIAALEGGGELTRVAGLVLNLPDGQLFTGTRELVPLLDSVPFPDRSRPENLKGRYYLGFRRPVITVETSRGCPYRCNFCSVWRFHRKKFRSQSAERVIEELSRLPEGDVLFTDDNFLANISRASRIADLIKSRRLPLRRYIFQARSDSIVNHPDIVRQWKEVGLDQVFIGFEKIDQEGMEQINKQNTVENNEKALTFLRALNIGVYASFIVDPEFTKREFTKLKNYIKRLKIAQPYFTVLTPLPGTELFENVRERIVSLNYEFFDFLHAVLPTRLSLAEFYKEFTGLYRAAYLRPYHIWQTTGWIIKRLLRGQVSFGHLRRLWWGARLTANPKAYLAGLEAAFSRTR